MRVTRRGFLRAAGAFALGVTALGGYAFGIEPRYRLSVTTYRLTPRGWPADFRLRLAVVADLHAGEPYMPVDRIAEIVARTNALGADAIVLLGDYTAGHRFQTRPVTPAETARALARLEAPLGVHAVLGNHDWWEDGAAQRAGKGPPEVWHAFEAVGLALYENRAVRLSKDGRGFWLAGLGDQLAFITRGGRRWRFRGVDDLPGTLAQVTDDAPVILLAHEPDIFPRVPERVCLTISGHTHGGQVRLLGYSPVVPSSYGNRYAYGHMREDGRDLVVSGGLGCSILPVRFGVPPEILLIELGA